MIVSWNWLKDYVDAGCGPEEVAHRLTMAGLNLESIEPHGDDFAIDLEVTSNRPDCLGHVGVAREVGVVCGAAVNISDPQPATGKVKAADACSVEVQSPELCPQYTARVIRGVKIGPSPAWLQERLQAIGITPVNNVVDVTNYVLMECGQPLHAFDLDKLSGNKIIVRPAAANEQIEAIDHRSYRLTPGMCVIADAKAPVAIAGVMGGAATEVSGTTKNLLIESAVFQPMSVRATARALNLHSPSSYRFERGINPLGVDWASRRCCELILQTAGGELCEGVVAVEATRPPEASPVALRFARIEQVVGIVIPEARCLEILSALGLEQVDHRPGVDSTWRVPSWRRDLTREIDLIEEVARIHGYEHIPEQATLPTAAVAIRKTDEVRARTQSVLISAGFFEAITFSFTGDDVADVFAPPGSEPPLRVSPAAGEFGSNLRRSLIPSLLLSRRENERQGVSDADLFEIARVFRSANSPSDNAGQPIRLAMIAGRDLRTLKGVVEAIVQAINPAAQLTATALEHPGFQSGRAATLFLNDEEWGWIGELDRDGHRPLRDLKLREPVAAVELDFARLVAHAGVERKQQPLPEFPSVVRDFNFVIDSEITWDELAGVVRSAAGPLLERVSFVEQYQGKQIPAGKKSYVLGLTYRAADRTLTGAEIDAAQGAVVAAASQRLGASQR